MRRILDPNDWISDVLEVLEKVNAARHFVPVYKKVLELTGDEKQAVAVLEYILRINEELNAEKKAS
jgi:hypothetical protein